MPYLNSTTPDMPMKNPKSVLQSGEKLAHIFCAI
jgi:hypothetical protein